MRIMFGWAHMTQKEFNELPEYSCTIPTLTTIGKRWKAKKNYYDESKGWRMGEYHEHPTDNSKVQIIFSEISIEKEKQ